MLRDTLHVCSCSSGHRAARTRFVSEMMHSGEEAGIHSYGRCANNKQMPFDATADGGDHPHRLALGKLVAEYKYYLALDNSLCDECVPTAVAATAASSSRPYAGT